MLFVTPISLPVPTLKRATVCARSIPSRLHRAPLRAVLHTDNKNADNTSEHPPDETRLRQEQLGAYFQSDESTYQSRLRAPIILALQNFVVELGELNTALRRILRLETPLKYTPPDCLHLRLSNEAVFNREREREFAGEDVGESPFIRAVYDVSCQLLDLRFDGRPIQRFWVLETVARMPYFAYTSCLHLLASLGWYRSPTLMNMHHAEELNEAYHLAIMESLGGDRRWSDRFLAFHASIIYYWFLVILFFITPAEAYRFSQLIERHAVVTYEEFIHTNEELLRQLPAPDVAHEYFSNFMYYFYEFQLGKEKNTEHAARPDIKSLYNVFENIILDEREHSDTMQACTAYIEKGDVIWYNGRSVSGTSRRENNIPMKQREEFWRKWEKLANNDDE